MLLGLFGTIHGDVRLTVQRTKGGPGPRESQINERPTAPLVHDVNTGPMAIETQR